jgi:quinol monooxygenase YgiN
MAEHPDHFKVVSIAKAKPGHIKDLEPLIHEITEKSRKEPGTLKIDVYKVREQEGVYVWLEQYKTEADFTAHKASEHFKDIIIRSTPFLLEPPTILSLEKEKI